MVYGEPYPYQGVQRVFRRLMTFRHSNKSGFSFTAPYRLLLLTFPQEGTVHIRVVCVEAISLVVCIRAVPHEDIPVRPRY